MAADVLASKEGGFHTQIICLKEDTAKTGEMGLTGEKIVLTKKVKREDLFFNLFILFYNDNQTGSAGDGAAFFVSIARFFKLSLPHA